MFSFDEGNTVTHAGSPPESAHDINGRPVRTTRTYGRAKKHCMQCFFPHGPYVRAVLTGSVYRPLVM